MCEQACSTDAEENWLYGADHRCDELPQELPHRQARLATIREAKARLEQAQREADTARGRHKDDDRKPPRGDLAVTEKVVREVLTLPVHSNMRPEIVERVIEGVTSYFS